MEAKPHTCRFVHGPRVLYLTYLPPRHRLRFRSKRGRPATAPLTRVMSKTTIDILATARFYLGRLSLVPVQETEGLRPTCFDKWSDSPKVGRVNVQIFRPFRTAAASWCRVPETYIKKHNSKPE